MVSCKLLQLSVSSHVSSSSVNLPALFSPSNNMSEPAISSVAAVQNLLRANPELAIAVQLAATYVALL